MIVLFIEYGLGRPADTRKRLSVDTNEIKRFKNVLAKASMLDILRTLGSAGSMPAAIHDRVSPVCLTNRRNACFESASLRLVAEP